MAWADSGRNLAPAPARPVLAFPRDRLDQHLRLGLPAEPFVAGSGAAMFEKSARDDIALCQRSMKSYWRQPRSLLHSRGFTDWLADDLPLLPGKTKLGRDPPK